MGLSCSTVQGFGTTQEEPLALLEAGRRGTPGQLGGPCVPRKTKNRGIRYECANKVRVSGLPFLHLQFVRLLLVPVLARPCLCLGSHDNSESDCVELRQHGPQFASEGNYVPALSCSTAVAAPPRGAHQSLGALPQ